jgi:hypothetical protein
VQTVEESSACPARPAGRDPEFESHLRRRGVESINARKRTTPGEA